MLPGHAVGILSLDQPVEGKRGRARSWGYGNPGKTPGAGGRLNRSSFPFISSLWGSSCICCRKAEKETKKIRSVRNSAKHFQRGSERERSSAALDESSEKGRDFDNGSMFSILTSCVITNICKLIRETKSLATGVLGPRKAWDTQGQWH